MLYFPQLVSGATAQYPFVKRRVHRTVANTLRDGRTLKLHDAGATRVQWEFTFETLNEQERALLEEFVKTVEGRLGEFTLLDPTDNLLVWSENLDSSAWTKGPYLTINGGQVTNTGVAEQSVSQSINGPGWYHYCFSLYARSATAVPVRLFRTTGGSTEERAFTLSGAWKRLVLTGKSESIAESVTFGLTLPPGAAIDMYGAQAEAQPAPSAYRRTAARSGIYPDARLEDDTFALISEGPDQHSCRIRIGAPVAT